MDSSNQKPLVKEDSKQLMNICIGLAVATICLNLAVTSPLWLFFATAARHLHNSMFHRVMRAPTKFFDTNPIGRLKGPAQPWLVDPCYDIIIMLTRLLNLVSSGSVLNRFSRDLGFVDLMLPEFAVAYICVSITFSLI